MLDCASGSTTSVSATSVFVLPQAQQAKCVPAGAQSSTICAPGSTSKRCLCSREQNQARVVPAGAHTSLLCAPADTGWWESSEKSEVTLREERGDLKGGGYAMDESLTNDALKHDTHTHCAMKHTRTHKHSLSHYETLSLTHKHSYTHFETHTQTLTHSP